MHYVQDGAEMSSDPSTYQAGFEAAINHLQKLMYHERGPRNAGPLPAREFGEDDTLGIPDPGIPSSVGMENGLSAFVGLPTPLPLSLDSPMFAPPETNVFGVAPDPWEGNGDIFRTDSRGSWT